jgi:hypothetical protein
MRKATLYNFAWPRSRVIGFPLQMVDALITTIRCDLLCPCFSAIGCYPARQHLVFPAIT